MESETKAETELEMKLKMKLEMKLEMHEENEENMDMRTLYDDAMEIIGEALERAKPDMAVSEALSRIDEDRILGKDPHGRSPLGVKHKLVLVAAGKAAWQMAKAAAEELGKNRMSRGVVITKYGHVMGEIPGVTCYEAGHPVPDENSFMATEAAIEEVSDLSKEDAVLFLLSGGGSALFEKPLVPKEELESVTRQLLACGADIVEMNTVRKRLSAVKGGRFAQLASPAHVYTIVLSDIIGDPLDMIASGPAYPDSSTCEQAREIIKKYGIKVSPETIDFLNKETPKELDNVTTIVTGSVKQLCDSAAKTCRRLGYEPVILTEELCCQAREAGSFLGTIARTHSHDEAARAFIAGGETVVKLMGSGKGGRNQELALAAAPHIAGLDNVAVFSVGSDGTDGPTDAAGGYVDGTTVETLAKQAETALRSIEEILDRNDAYHGLKASGGLIITGPTGTNVNDLSVVLVGDRRK